MNKLCRPRSRLPESIAGALMAALVACGSDRPAGPSPDIDGSPPAGDSLAPDPPPISDSLAGPDSLTPPDSLPAPDSLPIPDSLRSSPLGIPFGFMRQPNSAFSVLYNGAKQTTSPGRIMSSLEATRARGGRVILMLAGHENVYKDAHGHFSFSKWKARIDRYKDLDLSSYINDGTIFAHFMIDEPQDKSNWNGVPLTGAQVEEMAKYSKQLWPNMATVVRAPPGKLAWSGTYTYLDGAWAQVENPKGKLDVDVFLDENVSAARSLGLSLVVGLNVTKGNLNRTQMTPAQIKSWGSTLLSSPYACAFISWRYDPAYLEQSDVIEAMATLAEKARNRPITSCRTRSQSAVRSGR